MTKHWEEREIISSARNPMTLINGRYVYEAVNEAGCRALNRTREDIIGRSVEHLWGSESFLSIIKPNLDRCLSGQEVHFEDWFEFPGLGRRYFRTTYTPYPGESGKITHVVVTTLDMTEELRLQEMSSGNKHRIRRPALDQTLLDTIPIPIFLKDSNLRYIGCNKAYEDFLSIRQDEFIGRTLHEIAPNRMIDTYHAKDIELMNNPGVQVYETQIRDKTGATHDVVFHKATFAGVDGNIAGLIGLIFDTTEQKKSESLLRETEQLYRTLSDKSFAGVYVVQDGIFRFINNNAASYAGYSADELLGKPSGNLVHPDDREQEKKNSREMLSGQRQTPYEFRILTKNGQIRWIMETVAYISYEGRNAILGNSMDVTEQKIREENLRQSEERYRTILDNTEDAYFEVDLKGKPVFFNDSAARMIGYSKQEMVGLDFRKYLDEENARKVFSVFSEVYSTGRPSGWFDCEFLRRDGRCGYAEFSVILIRDAEGNAFGFRGIIRDVTERISHQKDMQAMIDRLEKAYDALKQSQSKIIHQEKMASIGQLSAGVAHEINNPLGFIAGNLGILRTYVSNFEKIIAMQDDVIRNPDSQEMHSALDAEHRKLKIDYLLKDIDNLIRESLEGAERVKKIVLDLKTFAREVEEEQKMEYLNEGLDSTINIVWNEIKHKANLKKEYGDIPLTRCNIGRLNQVFMNLLVNAAQAIEKWGEITVKTWDDRMNIYISVSDTGSGIPEEHLNRLFDPFFTTKEVGKGTGLGLSVSREIIKKHNGEIFVDSRIGSGTTFTVRIPIVAE